jgi:hypothetical protein
MYHVIAAGKVSDIEEEINDKSTAVKFMVKVDKVDLERKIELSNFKVNSPGAPYYWTDCIVNPYSALLCI